MFNSFFALIYNKADVISNNILMEFVIKTRNAMFLLGWERLLKDDIWMRQWSRRMAPKGKVLGWNSQ